MRLINVWTLGLEWFDDEAGPPPPYVVLSHVHGDDDVSLADLGDLPGRAGKTAILKLENVCRVTREHRLADYAWIDTCCIDRTSTRELSTALNSLFTWFRNAVVCFAYLADVDAAASVAADDSGGGNLPLWRSRWFTRGWTLPELLAPRRVEFFDRHWRALGSKLSLLEALSARTGIPRRALEDPDGLAVFSVAERMSWAASRQTSRDEDRAYCLLGIFGVRMPIDYGEGSRAFTRLQECILEHHYDPSIFAWRSAKTRPSTRLLADSPSEFERGAKQQSADPVAIRVQMQLRDPEGLIFGTILISRNGATHLSFQIPNGNGASEYNGLGAMLGSWNGRLQRVWPYRLLTLSDLLAQSLPKLEEGISSMTLSESDHANTAGQGKRETPTVFNPSSSSSRSHDHMSGFYDMTMDDDDDYSDDMAVDDYDSDAEHDIDIFRKPEDARRRLPPQLQSHLKACARAALDTFQRSAPAPRPAALPTPARAALPCPFLLRPDGATPPGRCATRADPHSMRALRLHLGAAHRRPVACPRCGERFACLTACDVHLRRRRGCAVVSPAPWGVEGVTTLQMLLLARPDDPALSEEEQWAAVWRVVFCGAEDPPPPPPDARAVPPRLESVAGEAALLRAFWAREGRSFAVEYMRRNQLQEGVGRAGDDAAMVLFREALLDEMVDGLLEQSGVSGER